MGEGRPKDRRKTGLTLGIVLILNGSQVGYFGILTLFFFDRCTLNFHSCRVFEKLTHMQNSGVLSNVIRDQINNWGYHLRMRLDTT